MSFDITTIRKDFPILNQGNSSRPWIYFDSAATTQKPQCVIESINRAYQSCNANVHRGVYKMSREATEHHESARLRIARFIGASSQEVIFTRGTTESINLVAATFGNQYVQEGDEILISAMEHHSNLVPWQQLALRKGAKLRIAPLHKDGSLDREAFRSALNERTRLVAIAHISNVLGTVNPVKELIKEAHQVGAKVLIDGAQAIAHCRVDVRDLDCDFYAFSGHKVYAPTGIGVLYGKEELLDAMPPYHFGGEMIEKVTFETTSFNKLPHKFEAGTPDYVGSVALATAVDYIDSIGLSAIAAYEEQLLNQATEALKSIDGVHLIGTAAAKGAVISFVTEQAHPYDICLLLDELGFALRSGHHCAEPLLATLGLSSTLRASFALYNTREEIDLFIEALRKVLRLF